MVKRKCDSCGEWNEGKPKYCIHCNDYLEDKVREADEKQARKEAARLKREAEIQAKPPIVRFFYKVGAVAESIYIAFVTFLAWAMAILGG